LELWFEDWLVDACPSGEDTGVALSVPLAGGGGFSAALVVFVFFLAFVVLPFVFVGVNAALLDALDFLPAIF
jgi:hypothetical protein